MGMVAAAQCVLSIVTKYTVLSILVIDSFTLASGFSATPAESPPAWHRAVLGAPHLLVVGCVSPFRLSSRPLPHTVVGVTLPCITMAYNVPPPVDVLKKCMGWFSGAYNASVYAPALLWDGATVARESVPPLVPLSSPLKVILFCLLATFIVSFASNARKRLPPHPRRLPIIGNLSQLADKRWLSSRDCKERFSEYRVSIGACKMLIGLWDTRRGHVP